jgi:hypothetical protein
MFKVTPNPPNGPDLKLDQAAHRAIDHYLNPSAEPPLPLDNAVQRCRRRQQRNADRQ